MELYRRGRIAAVQAASRSFALRRDIAAACIGEGTG
jgi:hypothetical protein